MIRQSTTPQTQITLEVKNLQIVPRANPNRAIVKEISFAVNKGECLAVLGESGAGKSLALQAVCGLLPPCLKASGTVLIHNREVLSLGYNRKDRGQILLYLSQQPAIAFDPLEKLGSQLIETLRNRFPSLSKQVAWQEIRKVLLTLHFEDPDSLLKRYPNELSGGMLQRLMIACVLLLKPEIVVADEPTSALDALSIQDVLTNLERIRKETTCSLIVVTHNLSFAQSIADQILVMKDGVIIEQGTTGIISNPHTPYFKHLVQMRDEMGSVFNSLAADALCPFSRTLGEENTSEVFLSATNIHKTYHSQGNFFGFQPKDQHVLNGVNLEIKRSEIVGLAGASGVGKTTLSRLFLGLELPDQGEICIEGEKLLDWKVKNPLASSVIFQNYTQSVNPIWTVRKIILEPMQLMNELAKRSDEETLTKISQETLVHLLRSVGLDAEILDKFPHELSGGQLQRVCLARALITKPKFIIFDEALSSLDASIQGEIVRLLKSMPKSQSAWLFISHDLKALTSLCDRIVFLHQGKIVESVSKDNIFNVRHPAASQLVQAARLL